MPKDKFNKPGEKANNKRHFLKTGKPKKSKDGSIDLGAEMQYVSSCAYTTHGVKDLSSQLKDDSPLPSQD